MRTSGSTRIFVSNVRPGNESADWTADRPHLLTLGMASYTKSGVISRPSLGIARPDLERPSPSHHGDGGPPRSRNARMGDQSVNRRTRGPLTLSPRSGGPTRGEWVAVPHTGDEAPAAVVDRRPAGPADRDRPAGLASARTPTARNIPTTTSNATPAPPASGTATPPATRRTRQSTSSPARPSQPGRRRRPAGTIAVTPVTVGRQVSPAGSDRTAAGRKLLLHPSPSVGRITVFAGAQALCRCAGRRNTAAVRGRTDEVIQDVAVLPSQGSQSSVGHHPLRMTGGGRLRPGLVSGSREGYEQHRRTSEGLRGRLRRRPLADEV